MFVKNVISGFSALTRHPFKYNNDVTMEIRDGNRQFVQIEATT